MSCDITRGRLVNCKNGIGGLKAIFIAKSYSDNVLEVANVVDGEVITAGFASWQIASGSPAKTEVFKYDLVQNLSSMTVNVNSDNANGTTFFTQTLSITLQQIDHDMTNELKLIAYARPQIFVQDSMDKVYLLGAENGCHVTGGTVVTGAAMGDMQGYTIEWGGEETDPLLQLYPTAGPTTSQFPFDGLTDEASLTITAGT